MGARPRPSVRRFQPTAAPTQSTRSTHGIDDIMAKGKWPVAVIIWLGGIWATRETVGALALDVDANITLIVALLIQALLTWLQWGGIGGNMWRLRGSRLVDTAVNAGGLWMHIQFLDQSPVGKMLSASIGMASPSTSQVGTMFFTEILISIFLGYWIARMPEQILKGD